MQTRVSLIFNLLNLLNLGSFMLNAGDLAVEYAYVTKLAEATGNSDLAVVGLGSGFYVQVLCVALQFIICFGFATLVLAKPWTK
ncbi:hypothetical protein WICPIJ_004575 [Wickerhamomyces pijperi]|nr:hypothetical protein WICPIJ_004575 [Wickerhamomyces pijperi]